MEKKCKKKCFKDLIIENQKRIIELKELTIKNKDDTIAELLELIRDLGIDMQINKSCIMIVHKVGLYEEVY